MPESIHYPTENEKRLADQLRQAAIDRMHELDDVDVQAALEVAKSGLERLLAEPEWNLRKAFRVADCLNLPVVETLISTTQNIAEQ